MLFRLCAVSLLTAIVSAGMTLAEAPKRLSEIDDLKPLVERWDGIAEEIGIAGYAVALIRDGELLAAEGFGTRDMRTAEPVTPDTMFYIASCTKAYVAAAVVHLASEGLLDLDAPVKSYLPEFTLADTVIAESVTIRDLLGHKLGIDSPTAVYLDAFTGGITEELYYQWLAETTPTGQIRYTNVHYTLLGRVIERVAGQNWKDYLASAIFKPAGMTRTTGYASELYSDENVAFPMEIGTAGLGHVDVVKTDAVMHAAGGLGSSILDGAAWLRMHVNEGQINGRAVFTPDAMAEILTLQSTFEKPQGSLRTFDGYAAAWQAGTWRQSDTRYYQHRGGYPGTAAHLSFMPDEGLAVAVFTNMSPEGHAMADVISIDYYDAQLGILDRNDPLPWYVNNIAEYRSEADEDPIPRFTAGFMSQPARAYLGHYTSDSLGDAQVCYHLGELALRIGAILYTMHAVDEGTIDAYYLQTAGDLIAGRFEIGHDGTPKFLTMELNGREFQFDRNR